MALAVAACLWTASAAGQLPEVQEAIAIEGATLLPMTSEAEPRLENHTLVVQGGRISALCPSTPGCTPPGALHVDGHGKFVLPALADMHNHFGGFPWDGTDASRIRMRNQNLRQYVMFGVATVRDPSGGPETLAMRDAIDRGELFGPRVFASSRVMDGNPPLFPGLPTFSEAAAAVRYVEHTAEAGYDFLKVYSTLSPEVFDAVMDAAAHKGLTVAAHVPMQVPLDHALRRGLRSIEHLTGYDVACAASETQLKPIAQDIYQGWAWCSPEKVQALAELTARFDVWNVPTLTLWDSTVPEYERPSRATQEIARWEHPTTPAGVDWLYQLYGPRERAGITGTRSTRLALVKALHDAGAPLLIGTDISAPGLTVHREMAAFVEAGLSTWDTLVAATAEAARYLDREGELGVLAEGARGDVLLLAADPLEHIEHTRRIIGLAHQGRWWSVDAIARELETLQREYAEDAKRLEALGAPSQR